MVSPAPPSRPTRARRRLAVALLAVAAALVPLLSWSAPAAAVECADLGDPKARFVCLSYDSFLERSPSFVEEDYWVAQLPARKTVMLAALARSEESRRLFIDAYYLTYAGYHPSEGEIAYWLPEVLVPNGLRRLQAGLLGSYSGMIDGFVDHTYATVLGRSPSAAERDYWGLQVVAKGRTLVAADIIFTLEARRTTVVWTYYNEQFVDVDTASRDYWAARLRSGFSYLDLRIALKTVVYPLGSGACSSHTPPIGPSPGCGT